MDFLDKDDPEQNLDDAIKPKSTAVKKPGGTFASMGLSRPIIRAVERKGYKLATPIQRKCIPAIMTGRDVVAMARTGSGKSAAFILPLIDKLKIRQPKADIRALILSPTRELATQTFKFVREFTKFTNLISKLIIGGESINRDFETITSCPDILVATPGRLAHILVEMKQKFAGLEIVVMDEADRLFEPGFKEIEQVNEICSRMPDSKQTLLFSATMPQKLADFAKAGLKNPLFIRLDVETNLSDTLKAIHLHCNQQDKFAILIYLLKKFVKKEQIAVVFMPTKHHIEYTKMLLDNAQIQCSQVYSTMDPEARKINIDRFTKKNCSVMLVTDLAARGIDIPILDIVINFNFPFKPKLFIHRVGRVARAGRFGCAISLIAHDETPYLHALHMFLDHPIKCASEVGKDLDLADLGISKLPDKILGTVPQRILDEENEILKCWHDHNEDLKAMVRVCDNAMKPYLKTRETPEPYSVKAAKDVHKRVIGIHPLFMIISANQNEGDENNDFEIMDQETNLLERIKSYKPQATIFEVGHIKGNRRTEAFEVMQKKRQFHDKLGNKKSENDISDSEDIETDRINTSQGDSESKESNIKKSFEDSKFYLKYKPDDYSREKGLELDKSSFNNDLKKATFDMIADDEDQMKRQKHQTVWDRKRKKFVKADDGQKKVKKIKTESGAYISSSYQSGLFEKWKNQSKFEQKLSDDDDDDNDSNDNGNNNKSFKKGRGRKQQGGKQMSIEKLRSKLKPNNRRSELKRPEVMMKERNIKEKREAVLRLKTQAKAARKNNKGGGGSGGKAKGQQKGKGGGRSSFGGGGGGGKKMGNKFGGRGQKRSSASSTPSRGKAGAGGPRRRR